MGDLVDDALSVITPRLSPTARLLVAITGPPGAGKSTLAEAVAERVGDAVVVPMDGFHLSNQELERLGLTGRKGAPETFDAAGFVELVRRIRAADELVYAPAYSRVLHESIGGVVAVDPRTRLVLVEGNYLLLPRGRWAGLRELFDLSLYLDAPTDDRVAGLVRRQLDRGLAEAAAWGWVLRSDEVNADQVATTRDRADYVVTRPSKS